MDFRFSAADVALREDARDFVRAEWQNPGVDLTGGLAAWHGDEEERAYGHELMTDFSKKLVKKGWYTMHWPEEHGGKAASIETQLAYREVMAYEDAPAWSGWSSPGG